MPYTEIKPNGQDDLFVKIGDWAKNLLFRGLSLLTLLCSGTGSGKSNIISYIPFILHNNAGITYIIAPNEQLMTQIWEVCREPRHKKQMYLVNGMAENAERMISVLLKQGRSPIVFFYNLGKDVNDFNKNARKMKYLVQNFNVKCVNQLALFDELDSTLTNITGGINSKLDISKAYIDEYRKICEQEGYSLNAFDIMRENNVKCIGLSATMNNLICSKLASIGYSINDISIINVNPIEALYKNLKVVPCDVNNFECIAKFLVEAEKESNKKTLLVFPDKAKMKEFIKSYRAHFKKEVSYVEITCDNSKERKSDSWKDSELPNAKYVMGIDIVTTGYDISTHVKGVEFNLGILFRKLSDKVSQPISKNPTNPLYMETSAKIIQTMSRLRKGGTFLLHKDYEGITSLFTLQNQVFETIRDGRNEFLKVGKPRSSQRERFIQQYLQNLLQNLREDDYQRPTVIKILSDISENFDKRDFKEESKKVSFDSEYWIHTIGKQLDKYVEEFTDSDETLTPEQKESKKREFSKIRNRTTEGGGYKDPRKVDEAVKQKVIERATCCCHCGKKFDVNDELQVCHVQRKDDSGPYSLDNLMYGHKYCDAAYDGNRLIHDPKGGYWMADTIIFKPDMKQLKYISAGYIHSRWLWAMSNASWGKSSEATFRDELKERGYVYFK